MFINPPNHLLGNICPDTVPVILKDAPQVQIDNPIALQMSYLSDPRMKNRRVGMRKDMTPAEQDAVDVLVNLFDCVDGLELQPEDGDFFRYEESQNI
jgi:hypothetical protein